MHANLVQKSSMEPESEELRPSFQGGRSVVSQGQG